MAIATSAGLAYPLAMNFEAVSFVNRLLASAAYLGTAAGLAAVYCFHAEQPLSWGRAIIGACVMLVTASVIYSLIRQQVVLLVFPALFCLPGGALGGSLALALVERAKRTEKDSKTEDDLTIAPLRQ